MVLIEPRLRALVLWIYEKNVLPILLIAICLYISSDLLYFSSFVAQDLVNLMKDVAFGLVTLAFLFLLWKRYTTKYYVLDSYIHMKSSGKWVRIPYEKIEDVKIKQGVLEGLLRIGKIVIKTPEDEYILEGVGNLDRVFEEIVRKKLNVENQIERAFKL